MSVPDNLPQQVNALNRYHIASKALEDAKEAKATPTNFLARQWKIIKLETALIKSINALQASTGEKSLQKAESKIARELNQRVKNEHVDYKLALAVTHLFVNKNIPKSTTASSQTSTASTSSTTSSSSATSTTGAQAATLDSVKTDFEAFIDQDKNKEIKGRIAKQDELAGKLVGAWKKGFDKKTMKSSKILFGDRNDESINSESSMLKHTLGVFMGEATRHKGLRGAINRLNPFSGVNNEVAKMMEKLEKGDHVDFEELYDLASRSDELLSIACRAEAQGDNNFHGVRDEVRGILHEINALKGNEVFKDPLNARGHLENRKRDAIKEVVVQGKMQNDKGEEETKDLGFKDFIAKPEVQKLAKIYLSPSDYLALARIRKRAVKNVYSNVSELKKDMVAAKALFEKMEKKLVPSSLSNKWGPNSDLLVPFIKYLDNLIKIAKKKEIEINNLEKALIAALPAYEKNPGFDDFQTTMVWLAMMQGEATAPEAGATTTAAPAAATATTTSREIDAAYLSAINLPPELEARVADIEDRLKNPPKGDDNQMQILAKDVNAVKKELDDLNVITKRAKDHLDQYGQKNQGSDVVTFKNTRHQEAFDALNKKIKSTEKLLINIDEQSELLFIKSEYGQYRLKTRKDEEEANKLFKSGTEKYKDYNEKNKAYKNEANKKVAQGNTETIKLLYEAINTLTKAADLNHLEAMELLITIYNDKIINKIEDPTELAGNENIVEANRKLLVEKYQKKVNAMEAEKS